MSTTRFKFYGKLIIILCLAWGLWLVPAPLLAQGSFGHHCGSLAPYACQWGLVHHAGRPVADAVVTFTHLEQVETISTTLNQPHYPECFPYYGERISDTQQLDIITATVAYNGETISRAVRVMVNCPLEQRTDFVVPLTGAPRWTTYASGVAPQTLVIHDDTLWAGAVGALHQWNLSSGCLITHTIDISPLEIRTLTADNSGHIWVGMMDGVREYDGQTWVTHTPSMTITALAVDSQNHIWAGSTAGVYEYDRQRWITHPTGLAATDIRAIAVDPRSDEVCIGTLAGRVASGVSCYDGAAWRVAADFNGSYANNVSALAIDARGHLWIGTYGTGVTECADTTGITCTTYTPAVGLASKYINDIVVGQDILWFAHHAYTGSAGEEYGGVSRFDGQTWMIYTTAQGLGSNEVLALAGEQDGTTWAGTTAGISRFHDPALSAPLTVTISTLTPSVAVQERDVISFSAVAQRAGGGVVAYEWRSNQDGLLSTIKDFDLEATTLSLGTHQVSFRAQNEEGFWSEVVTAALRIVKKQLYLPLVLKNG